MEETRFILDNCDQYSLLAIDELGRGTSTFDGVSLACATLKYLIKKDCMCMFTTHFNLESLLSEEDR